MNLLEDLRMSLSSFNFVMIHTIHKILVLIKNHMNYLHDFFLRSIVDFYLKKECKKQFNRSGENTEKYIIFKVLYINITFCFFKEIIFL